MKVARQFRRDKSRHLGNFFEHFNILVTTRHALFHLTRTTVPAAHASPRPHRHEFFRHWHSGLAVTFVTLVTLILF